MFKTPPIIGYLQKIADTANIPPSSNPSKINRIVNLLPNHSPYDPQTNQLACESLKSYLQNVKLSDQDLFDLLFYTSTILKQFLNANTCIPLNSKDLESLFTNNQNSEHPYLKNFNTPNAHHLFHDFLQHQKQQTHPLFTVHNNKLYTTKLLNLEKSLAQYLIDKQNIPSQNLLPPPNNLPVNDKHLSDEQKHAVFIAYNAPLSLITGGPGTGKTTVITAIVKRLLENGANPEKIKLVAPTAKAANRITQALNQNNDQSFKNIPQSTTIHRLIGLSTHSLKHTKDFPILADTVIIDEFSMLDLKLANHLLNAIPSHTRVIAIGDDNQLPAIEAGSVLENITSFNAQNKTLTIPHTHLAKNYRMRPDNPNGNAIFNFSRYFRNTDPIPLNIDNYKYTDINDLSFNGVEILKPDTFTLNELIKRWIQHWFTKYANQNPQIKNIFLNFDKLPFDPQNQADLQLARELLDSLENYKILSPIKNSPSGLYNLNQAYTKIFPQITNIPHNAQLPLLYSIQKNDYNLELFNGDTAILLTCNTSEKNEPCLFFLNHNAPPRTFPLQLLKHNITQANAITIHKSQGSEYNHVLIVLPQEDSPMLTKQLIYTALTRAKQSTTIIANLETLHIASTRSCSRYTSLFEHIPFST